MITRREWIGGTVAALAATDVRGAAGPYTTKSVTPPDWYFRAMRWLTMNLVQDDPGKVDLDFWLDYLKRAHVDAASWNSGGIVAFYPTNIPYHKRNAQMGNSDPFGYLVEGCRKMGLVVTARVDHHATYPETAMAHPEWICTDEKGQKRPHWAMPNLYLTCELGPYNEYFMTEVMKEIESMYRVDGFNHNRWAPQRMCYCEWCRKAFRKYGGEELPSEAKPDDPRWARYALFKEDRMFQLWDHWNASIQKINANAFVLPGMGGERDQLNLSKLRARAKTLYLDYQGRDGLTAPWMAGKKGKELRAVLGHNPAGITFSVGPADKYRWKDSVQSPAELKVWVHTGAAHGLRPKMAKFAGTLYDKRWEQPVEEIYTWLWKNEKYLRNTGYPVATVGLINSQQTSRFYGEAKTRGYVQDDHSKGIYHALIEARIPNDIVHEDLLDESELDRFRVLVLPNVACLSDHQCAQIRRFVERGGSLVATLESSLYNEAGERRKDFALGDLFGVSAAGPVQGPMLNSYLRLNGPHPLLKGMEDAQRMVNGAYRVPVKPIAEFPAKPLLFVAPYPDLPMEEVYPRDLNKNVPEIFVREIGRSRIVYVPFDLDRMFWDMLDMDHGKLIANAVSWAAHDDIPLEINGHGVLDVAIWRQQQSITVHLVNITNPMMMKGPFREIFPIGEQIVRVKLPEGAKPTRVQLLTAEKQPEHSVKDGWLTVAVPGVALHEVIAVDL